MNKIWYGFRKYLTNLIFHFKRKTEDFPLKVIILIIAAVFLIAIGETYFFYTTPPVKVSERLDHLPTRLRLPKSIQGKLQYSAKQKKLSFHGIMSDLDRELLEDLSDNDLYQTAINGLYKKSQKKEISLGESLWWAIVTLTTVGYGDYSPENSSGRFLAVILMGFGIVFTSVLSGTIASIFVERKLREGRGMKELIIHDHIVICGWNDTAENLLKSLPLAGGSSNLTVVLVNELDGDVVSDVKLRFKDLDIKFVKGDFTREEVLRRANIHKSKSTIILADLSGGHALVDADQRTIIAAFAIKNMAGDTKVAAELNKKENEEHLKRANVDDILIYGQFGGFLLSHAALSPGVPSMIMELLSFSLGNTIIKSKIPSDYVGKQFIELSEYYRIKRKSILIGILSEEKDITLDDILSDESGGIDQFIKKKFSEVENDYFGDDKPQINVKINPGDNYIIQDIDTAFLITKESN